MAEDTRRFRGDDGRGAPARGTRSLTAILPSGRVVWLKTEPPFATAGAVHRVAQQTESSARWRQAANEHQREAIGRLARMTAENVERLSEANLARANALRDRLVAGHDALEARVSKAIAEYRARVDRQMAIERESVRRLGRRNIWDQIVLATAGPLFAAYGQQGRPLGSRNVALTLALLIWLVGDEIVDAVFKRRKSSPYVVRDADTWSYLAPFGNLLAGWWLLHGYQHERFITGHTVIPIDDKHFEPDNKAGAVAPGDVRYRYYMRTDLEPFIAPLHYPDSRGFTGVPVVAQASTLQFSAVGQAANVREIGLVAEVRLGRLYLVLNAVAQDMRAPGAPLPSIFDAVDVAWMVDTAKPASMTTV